MNNQTPVGKLYTWTTGEVMGKEQPLRDAIGQVSFNIQYNPNCRCEISDSSEGAVRCAYIASHVNFSSKVVFGNISMEAEILASMTENGVSMTAERAEYFRKEGFPMKKNPDPYRSGYVAVYHYEPIGYMAPVTHQRPEATVQAPADLPIGVARFLDAVRGLLPSQGEDIELDGETIRAVPRTATLGVYCAQHENPDSARRIHARDADAAVEAEVVGRATIGDIVFHWPSPPRPEIHFSNSE